jgi:hypothetical protein
MSGVGRFDKDRINDLNEIFETLVETDSSAIVVKNGQYDTSATMALRSGLHRVFKQEKSSDDIKANRDTLSFLLRQIASHTGATTEEMMTIGDRKIRLGNEKEGYSVAERLQRGTYVSSELVRQLAIITGDVLGPQLEQQNADEMKALQEDARQQLEVQNQETQRRLEADQREAQRLEARQTADKIGKRNNLEIAFAFGRMGLPTADQKRRMELGDGELVHRQGGSTIERALAPQTDPRVKENGKDKVVAQTALTRALNELAGDDTIPKATRQALDDYWRNGVGTTKPNEREDLLEECRRQIWLAADDKAMAEGKGLNADDIKDQLKALMTSPEEMKKFAAIVEVNAQAEALRISEANAKSIREMSPQGLSDALNHFVKDNPELEGKSRQVLDTLARAGALNLGPGEMRLAANILKDIREDAGGPESPLLLVDELRTALRKAYDANPTAGELTTGDVARLLGNTLRGMLTKGEANVDQVVQTQLEADMNQLYPALLDMVEGIQAPSIGEFARTLLMPQIEMLAIRQALQSAKEDDKDLSSRGIQREAAEKAKQLIAKHREAQAKALALLDQYAAFRREVKSVAEREGGLPQASKETLQRLDAEADRFKRESLALHEYSDLLKTDFGDAFKDAQDALGSAAFELLDSTYDVDSGRADREYIARTEMRFAEIALPNSEPYVQPHWMRPTMGSLIAPHPALRSLVENFDPGINSRVRDNETFEDLVDSMVLHPMKQERYRNIQTDPSIRAEEKPKLINEHLNGMDNYWKDAVTPGLKMLTQYAKAPEPMQPTTRKSLDDYKTALTQYVNGAKDAQHAMQKTGAELNELGNDIKSDVDKRRCYQAGEAIVFAMNSIDDQIRYAQQKLDALG